MQKDDNGTDRTKGYFWSLGKQYSDIAINICLLLVELIPFGYNLKHKSTHQGTQ